MSNLGEQAMSILDELHTERLAYESEYVPLADAANLLTAYEETGMTPEGITKLLARAEAAEADNKKLCAAMMQLKRIDRPERMGVVYELEYDSSMSHKTMEEVAEILFRRLMDADLDLRDRKGG